MAYAKQCTPSYFDKGANNAVALVTAVVQVQSLAWGTSACCGHGQKKKKKDKNKTFQILSF